MRTKLAKTVACTVVGATPKLNAMPSAAWLPYEPVDLQGTRHEFVN